MLVLLGAEETRETFAGLETWQIVLWYCLIAVSVAIFLFGAARLALKYRRGRARRSASAARWSGRRGRRRSSPRTPGSAAATRSRASRTSSSSTASSSSSSGRRSWPSRTTSPSPCSAGSSGTGGSTSPTRSSSTSSASRSSSGSPSSPSSAASSGRSGSPTRAPPTRRPRSPARRGSTERGLGLPRQPLLPRPHGLPARGLPDRGRRPRPSRCGRRSAGSSATPSWRSGSTGSAAESATGDDLVGPRRLRALLGRLDPVHEGGAHARGPRRRGGEGRARRQPARAAPAGREARGGRLRDDRRARSQAPRSTSTPARSAASATTPARRRRRAIRSRRATSILDLREVAEGAMGNRAALRIPPRFPEHAELLGDDQARDALVVHAVHGVRRDLPGRASSTCRSSTRCAARSSSGARWTRSSSDARDDLHVGQLVRRGEAQARRAGRRSSTSR